MNLVAGIEPNPPQEANSKYKGKHAMTRPAVGSLATWYKNCMILWVSEGAAFGCYITAWWTLTFNNDAGAFFTDCMTMWSMYVYFFQDPDAINYSY